MRRLPLGAAAAALLLPLLAVACDASRPAPEPSDDGARRAAEAREQKAIDGIETDVRIKSLQAQVDRLEAEVAELKGGRQAIDTQLLSQRLDAIEGRVLIPAVTPTPTPAPTAAPTPSPRAGPRGRAPLDLKLSAPER